MTAPINYVLSPFEGNINTGDQTGLKLCLRATKEIEKKYDKLYISVSNAKYIIDHFLSLANKYGWERIAFMVNTGAGANTIFSVVDQIQLADTHTCKSLDILD